MATESVVPLTLETVELLTCERVTQYGATHLRLHVRIEGIDHVFSTQQRVGDILHAAVSTDSTGAMIGAAVAAFFGVKKGAEERRAVNEMVADVAGRAAVAGMQADTKTRLRKRGRKHW